MKSGLCAQPLSLMEELRATTSQAHAQVQAAPYFQALAFGQLPLESYVGHLRALAAIHGALERAIESSPDRRVASVWNRDMPKRPLLEQDLRYFEPRAVADLREAVHATLDTVEQLRTQAVSQPLALLGWLYVVEGSTQGADVVRPLVARAFLLTGDEGLAYLQGYGPAVRERWAEFRQRMNALHLSPDERAQISRAAGDCFDRLATILQALFPFRPESKVRLGASLNSEAGRQPVPTDPRELQASQRAADVCWQRYPYFKHRYGERGRRLARSDAAWQAALCQFEPAQVIQQVRWLGRVLAALGMPTLLLHHQLVILFGELVTAIPGKKFEYEKLLLAAADLHESRRRHLADAELQACGGEFDRAVGPDWNTRLPHTGILLGSAVADELAGNPGAVQGVRAWMTDAIRFPAAWIAAVEATLARASQYARLRGTTCDHCRPGLTTESSMPCN